MARVLNIFKLPNVTAYLIAGVLIGPAALGKLGIALLPQAGVALGMSAIAANAFGESGVLIRNITLFGVLIYELVGPMSTRMALTKAGDIKN